MSDKSEKTSKEGLDRLEKNSVYDFFYNDARRIASFLAQFDKDGHLTAFTRTLGVTDTTSSNSGMGGGINIAAVGNFNATGGDSSSETGSSLAASTYDPLWQNSLALLDYLEQRGMIGRSIRDARLGQFALVTGSLVVTDIAMIRAVICSKKGAAILARGIQDNQLAKEKQTGKPAKTKSQQADDFTLTTQMIQGMFESFPSAVVMHLIGDDFGVWATLRTDGLSGSINDLLLKHGGAPAGEWSVLGIVDALPNPEPIPTDLYFSDEMASHAIAELFTGMRPKMGRPDKAYGITPLLIFREVAGF